jgi:adenylate kinase
MKCSIAFKDGEPPEDAEDPEEAAKKLRFPWHCEKGIVSNMKLLNKEFNEFRKLNPVKIFITGPPASGKTMYGGQLASYYNIPHITVDELVNKAFDLAKKEDDGGDEFIGEIKSKIEELKDEMVQKIEEAN